MGFLIKIPKELLDDGRLELRVWSPQRWAEHVASLRAERAAMDSNGASRVEKVKATWRLKKAAAFKPTRPFLRFEVV